jgi:uncharacterized protein
MAKTPRPIIRELREDECEALLGRNQVGRIAYIRDDAPDIEPIHYVYEDGTIYGRTSKGTKVEATGYAWAPVAFEVDEIEALFRWRSVVVHGGFSVVPYYGTDWEADEWKRGVELLRELIPETFTDDDPTDFRTVVFRIAVRSMRGRAAHPDGEEP